MLNHVDRIVDIGDKAAKEFSIETLLDTMRDSWLTVEF